MIKSDNYQLPDDIYKENGMTCSYIKFISPKLASLFRNCFPNYNEDGGIDGYPFFYNEEYVELFVPHAWYPRFCETGDLKTQIMSLGDLMEYLSDLTDSDNIDNFINLKEEINNQIDILVPSIQEALILSREEFFNDEMDSLRGYDCIVEQVKQWLIDSKEESPEDYQDISEITDEYTEEYILDFSCAYVTSKFEFKDGQESFESDVDWV